MDMVLEYAVYLGMDPEVDGELLWIAEQALRAPVPVGWEEGAAAFSLQNLSHYNGGDSTQFRQQRADDVRDVRHGMLRRLVTTSQLVQSLIAPTQLRMPGDQIKPSARVRAPLGQAAACACL